jgi:acyl-CoA synthetase (AMP-forming)/AMP-acid ligase II
MIISGGYNIYPSELENVIAGHPQVIEVAVVGVPHDKWGETPCAICVVRDESAVSEADIQQLVGTVLGSYKKPSLVQFRTGALPKSPVGKIKRKDLREPFWRGIDRRISGS